MELIHSIALLCPIIGVHSNRNINNTDYLFRNVIEQNTWTIYTDYANKNCFVGDKSGGAYVTFIFENYDGVDYFTTNCEKYKTN